MCRYAHKSDGNRKGLSVFLHPYVLHVWYKAFKSCFKAADQKKYIRIKKLKLLTGTSFLYINYLLAYILSRTIVENYTPDIKHDLKKYQMKVKYDYVI